MAGPLLVAAAFVADGASNRAWKILLLVALVMLNGAATSHAVARATAWRGSGQP